MCNAMNLELEWNFKCFSKQDQAINYSRRGAGLIVMSWEYDEIGRRKYFVTRAEQFWSFYRGASPKNFYEVLCEGRGLKLIFDLEYRKEENVEKNGNYMTLKLIEIVNSALTTKFKRQFTREDVIVLDSTSETKFSHHLIFTTALFPDMLEMKFFVNFIKTSLSSEVANFFAVKHLGHQRSYIDYSVYSRNRNFRLFMSSKFSKSCPLFASSIDTFMTKYSHLSEEERMFAFFENSLVTAQSTPSPHAILPSVLTAMEHQQKRNTHYNHPHLMASKGTSTSSPFREIEELILNIIKPGGYIRSWRVYQGSLVYAIAGTRFCQNVQREHTRNHIFYICDLFNLSLVQRCHSPACLGYSSQSFSIAEVINWDWTNLPWGTESEEQIDSTSSVEKMAMKNEHHE